MIHLAPMGGPGLAPLAPMPRAPLNNNNNNNADEATPARRQSLTNHNNNQQQDDFSPRAAAEENANNNNNNHHADPPTAQREHNNHHLNTNLPSGSLNNNHGDFFDDSAALSAMKHSHNNSNHDNDGHSIKIPNFERTDSNKNSEKGSDHDKTKPDQDELDRKKQKADQEQEHHQQQQQQNQNKSTAEKSTKKQNADGTFTVDAGDDADMVLDDFAAFNDNKAPVEIVVDRGRMDLMRPVLEVPHSSYRILFVDPQNRADVVADHGYMAIKRAGWTRTQSNQYWIPSSMRKEQQQQQLLQIQQRMPKQSSNGPTSHSASHNNNNNNNNNNNDQKQITGGNGSHRNSKALNGSESGDGLQIQSQSLEMIVPADRNATPPPMLTFGAIAHRQEDGGIALSIPQYDDDDDQDEEDDNMERESDRTQKQSDSNSNKNPLARQQPPQFSALAYLSKASENIGHVDPTCQRFFRPLGYLTRDFVFFEDAMFEEDFFSLETILGRDGEKDEFDITEMAGVTRLQPTAVEPAESELRTYEVASFVLEALRKANGTDADPFVPPSTYKEYNPDDDDDDEDALGRYVSAVQEEHEAKKKKLDEEKRKIEDEKKKAQAVALKKQQEEQERRDEEERKRREEERKREEADAEAARLQAEADAKDPAKRKKALLKILNRFKLDYAKTHNGDKPSAGLMKVDPEISPVYKEYLQLKKLLKKQEGGGSGEDGSDEEKADGADGHNINKPTTPQQHRPAQVTDVKPMTPQVKILGALEDDFDNVDVDGDDPHRAHTTKTIGNKKLDKNEKRHFRNQLKELKDWKKNFMAIHGDDPTRADMITDHKVSGIILDLRKQFGTEDVTISDDEDEMPKDLVARKKWCAHKLNEWKVDFAASNGRHPTGKDVKKDPAISNIFEIYKNLKDKDDAALMAQQAADTPPLRSPQVGAAATPQHGLPSFDGAAIPQQHHKLDPISLARRRKQLGLELNRWRAAFLQLNGRKPTSRDVNADPHIKDVYKEYMSIAPEAGAAEAAARRTDLAQRLSEWKSLFAAKNGRKPTADDIKGDTTMADAYVEYNDLANDNDEDSNEAKKQQEEMLQAPSEMGGARLPLVNGSLEQDMIIEEKKDKETARRTSRKHELSAQLNAFKTAFVQRNGRKAKESDFLDDDAMRPVFEEFMKIKQEEDAAAAEEARIVEEAARFQRERDRHAEVVRLLNDWKKQFQMKNGKKPSKSDIEQAEEIQEIYQEFVEYQNKKKQNEQNEQQTQQQQQQQQQAAAANDDNNTANANIENNSDKDDDVESRKKFLLAKLNAWKADFKQQKGKGPTAKDIKNDPEMSAVFEEYNSLKSATSPSKSGAGGEEEAETQNHAAAAVATNAVNNNLIDQHQEETPAEKKKRVTAELNKWKAEFKQQNGKNPTVRDIKADATIVPIYEAYLSFKSGGDDKGGDQHQQDGADVASPEPSPQKQQQPHQDEQQQPVEESTEEKKKRLLTQLNAWKANFKDQNGKGPTSSDMKADPSIYPIFLEYQTLKKSSGEGGDEEKPQATEQATHPHEEQKPADDQQQQHQPHHEEQQPQQQHDHAEESAEDKKKRLLTQLNAWKANFKDQHGKGPTSSDMKADPSIYPAFLEYQTLKKSSGGDAADEPEAEHNHAAPAEHQPEAHVEESVEDKKKRLVGQLNQWKADYFNTHGKKPSAKDLQSDETIRPVFEEYQTLKKASGGEEEPQQVSEAEAAEKQEQERAELTRKQAEAEHEEEERKKKEAADIAAVAAASAAAEAAKLKAEQEEHERVTREKEEAEKRHQEELAAAAHHAAAEEEAARKKKEEEEHAAAAEKKRLEEEEHAAAEKKRHEEEQHAAEAAKKKADAEEAERKRHEADQAAADALAAQQRADEEKALAEKAIAAKAAAQEADRHRKEPEETTVPAAPANADATEDRKKELAQKLNAFKKDFKAKHDRNPTSEDINNDPVIGPVFKEYQELKNGGAKADEQHAASAVAETPTKESAEAPSAANVEDRKKLLAKQLNTWKTEFKAKHERAPTSEDINNDPTIKPAFDEFQALKKAGDSSPAAAAGPTVEEKPHDVQAPVEHQTLAPVVPQAAATSGNVEERKKELAQKLNAFKKDFKTKHDRNPTSEDINNDPTIRPVFDEYQSLKNTASPAAAEASPEQKQKPEHEVETLSLAPPTAENVEVAHANVEDRKKELAQKLNAYKKDFKAKHDKNPTSEDINNDPVIGPVFKEYQELKNGASSNPGAESQPQPQPQPQQDAPKPNHDTHPSVPPPAAAVVADSEDRKKLLVKQLNTWKTEFKAKHERAPTSEDINNDPIIGPVFKEYQELKNGGAKADEQHAAPAVAETPTKESTEAPSAANVEDRKKLLAKQLNTWKTEFKAKHERAPTSEDINNDPTIKPAFDEFQALKKAGDSSPAAAAGPTVEEKPHEVPAPVEQQSPPPVAENADERKKELGRKLNAFKKEFKEKHDRNPTAEDIKADAEIAAIFKEYEELKKAGSQ